jgi:Fe-S-cluster containining protein
MAHRLYDQGERNAPSIRAVACRKGCDYCCYAFTSVLAPEAFLLAEKLQQRSGGEGFKQRGQPLRRLDQKARGGDIRLPCPLLEEHLCSLHAERPLSCRKHASFTAHACHDAFDGKPTQVPVNAAYLTIGTTCSVTLRAALRSLGRPVALYELSEAVATILDTPDALARWTGGEDILAGVQTDTSTPPHLQSAVAGLAETMTALGGN